MRYLLVVLSVVALSGVTSAAGDLPATPFDSGLVEHVETRLIDVDLEVARPSDRFRRVEPDDLELWLGSTRISDFDVVSLGDGSRNPSAGLPLYRNLRTWRTLPHARLAPGTGATADEITTTTLVQRYRPGTPLYGRGAETIRLIAHAPAGLAPHAALRVVSKQRDLAVAFRPGDTLPLPVAGGSLAASFTPLGFEEGVYRGLLQVRFDGPPEAGPWLLEASVIAPRRSTAIRGRVSALGDRDEVLVVQDVVQVPPGSFDIVARARRPETGETVEISIPGRLESIAANSAVASPIALVQVPDGEVLRVGRGAAEQRAVVLSEETRVDASRALAVWTTVCRGRRADGPTMVRRSVEGTRAVAFEPVFIEPGGESCVLLEDRIESGTLAGGHFVYRLTVRDRGGKESVVTRSFDVEAAPHLIAEGP